MTAHAFYFSWRNEQACYDSLLLFGGASFRPSLDPDGLASERVIFPMNVLPVYSFFFSSNRRICANYCHRYDLYFLKPVEKKVANAFVPTFREYLSWNNWITRDQDKVSVLIA